MITGINTNKRKGQDASWAEQEVEVGLADSDNLVGRLQHHTTKHQSVQAFVMPLLSVTRGDADQEGSLLKLGRLWRSQ
jgi:hypothetical protein